MQLKITELASVYRKTQTETSSNLREEIPVSSNNITDMGKMIVMSGTAKRKPFEKIVTSKEPISIKKNQYHESFLKLRRPSYKSRQKQFHPGEKLMSKSCETLFEYLKPYKHIQVTKEKNFHKMESNKTIENNLKTTNIVYQTATRKVEIVSVFEENPNYGFNKNTSILDFLPSENNFSFRINHDSQEDEIRNLTTERNCQMKENLNVLQTTISSEDFVTNAFSEPRITFI